MGWHHRQEPPAWGQQRVEQQEPRALELVEQDAVQVVRRAELRMVVEDCLVQNMVEVARKVAVVHKDIADYREAAVRLDTVDCKVVVVRTVAAHIVAVHKVVSGHKVGKAGKPA